MGEKQKLEHHGFKDPRSGLKCPMIKRKKEVFAKLPRSHCL